MIDHSSPSRIAGLRQHQPQAETCIGKQIIDLADEILRIGTSERKRSNWPATV